MTQTPTDPAAAAARWYARTRADAPVDDEIAQLDAWIRADAAHGAAWDRVERIDASLSRVADDPAIAALRAEALTGAGAPLRAPFWRYAAAAAVVAGVGTLTIVGLQGGKPDKPGVVQSVRYATAVGQIRSVRLPDGTVMTLDAQSAARVAPPAATRQVAVDDGRALFAVAKDKAHPFVVSIAGTNVTALGTHFSVERRGPETVVALVEGSVRVVTPAGTRTLVPGDVLTASAGKLTVSDGAAIETTWVDGRLTFAATPLATVAATLNRYDTRRIVIRDAALAEHPYSGSLRTVGGGEALVAALVATRAARVVAQDDASVTLGR